MAPAHDPSPEVVPTVDAVKRLVVGAIVLVSLTKDEQLDGLRNLRSLGRRLRTRR